MEPLPLSLSAKRLLHLNHSTSFSSYLVSRHASLSTTFGWTNETRPQRFLQIIKSSWDISSGSQISVKFFKCQFCLWVLWALLNKISTTSTCCRGDRCCSRGYLETTWPFKYWKVEKNTSSLLFLFPSNADVPSPFHRDIQLLSAQDAPSFQLTPL